MSRGGLCPGRVGGSVRGRGSLSREEVSAQGGFCRDTVPESEQQAVDILLVCFLVRHEFTICTDTSM